MSVLTTLVPVGRIGDEKLLTADAFGRLSDTRGWELDDGRLVELKVGADSNLIAGEVYGHLWAFCRETRLGWAIPPDTAFQFFPAHPNRVGKPDGGFIRGDRMPGRSSRRTFIRVTPDLAVEVVSPNDKAEKVRRKAREYMDLKVPLLWVIYPGSGTALVHRPSGVMTDVAPDGFLDGEDVLPGFRLRLADLFPPDPTPAPAPASP
jgi:Uma2 family endonuclease